MTERRRSMSTSSQPWLKFRPGNSTSRFGLFEGIAIALAHRHADELAESRRGELNPRSAPYQGAAIPLSHCGGDAAKGWTLLRTIGRRVHGTPGGPMIK